MRGVRLPSEGEHFFTWDPVKRRSPNRPWRRWGTDRLVRLVLRIAREYRAAHPRAPRMAVGDLSRPRGGDFGPQFGYIGHASHQNGLDVDVYYPRADGRERAPRDASQIDRRLSQELVDRFVAAGAQTVFVGPNTGLHGAAGRRGAAHQPRQPPARADRLGPRTRSRPGAAAAAGRTAATGPASGIRSTPKPGGQRLALEQAGQARHAWRSG